MIDTKHAMQVTAKRVVARMLQASLATAVNIWKDYVSGQNQVQCVLAKGIARMRNVKLACALAAWHMTIRRWKHTREIGAKALARMMRLAVAYGFDALLSYARKMKRVRGMMLRCRHRLAMSVFDGWSEVVASEISARERQEEFRALKFASATRDRE